MQLKDAVWDKLMWMWVVFFGVQGGLNLYVALNYPEAIWVKFKLALAIGMPLIFAVIQAIWLARYLPQDDAAKES
jgi:intracellular septation protein